MAHLWTQFIKSSGKGNRPNAFSYLNYHFIGARKEGSYTCFPPTHRPLFLGRLACSPKTPACGIVSRRRHKLARDSSLHYRLCHYPRLRLELQAPRSKSLCYNGRLRFGVKEPVRNGVKGLITGVSRLGVRKTKPTLFSYDVIINLLVSAADRNSRCV